MIRVVHVVAAGEIGGAERMLLDLASSRTSHAVALLTPNEALARLFGDAGLRVYDRGRLDEGPVAFLASSLGERDVAFVASVLARERAAVAHLHTFASQVVGTRAALRAGTAVIRTEHSTRVYDDPSCWPFSRWSLRRAHASAAISEHVRRRALERAPWASAKMRVVYNGVDLARFAPAPPDATRPFRFAVVGRLEPRKGVDLAIDALVHVADAHLDIVGDGPDRVPLWKHALSRGVSRRVVFHGFRDDPRDVVARASAVLCSSRSEGLGNAVMEAMAMAKPVVGFAVGGVAELVVHGETGLLARPQDPEALAQRMREAMAAGARLHEWGQHGRTRVRERFSVAAMRRAYDDLYDAVVARSSVDHGP